MNENQSNEVGMSWRDAIIEVLKQSQAPLHPTEIVAAIKQRGLRDITGATPAATVGAHIYSSMKQDGEFSPFAKTLTGKFEFRQASAPPGTTPQLNRGVAFEDDEAEPKTTPAIVRAFGMYWQRDLVNWKTNPQILGRPNKANATPNVVDFCGQRGVYFLHDGSQVVYCLVPGIGYAFRAEEGPN